MKTVFLHGLGQTARDWQKVVALSGLSDMDCPALFALSREEVTYDRLLAELEARYADVKAPFRICGLSLGAILALDYTLRHPDQIASAVLIGAQYRVPTRLIDLQNLLFRLMPGKAFASIGLSKMDAIHLTRSMRTMDFTHRLGEVSCPAIIVCGEKDAANLKASRELASRLPHGTLHIIPGAGHEINRCAPDALAGLLKQ